MDKLTATKEALLREIDMPPDLDPSKLEREARDALQLARQGISREHLKAHLMNMLARLEQPSNPTDCDAAAKTILEISNALGDTVTV